MGHLKGLCRTAVSLTGAVEEDFIKGPLERLTGSESLNGD